MHRTVAAVQDRADPAAVRIELEAQTQRAKAAGIESTHIDTHMGTVVHPKFVADYLELAVIDTLPPMMLRLDEASLRDVVQRHTGVYLGDDEVAALSGLVREMEERGVPFLDRMSGLTSDGDPGERVARVKQAFDKLEPGLTHYILHPSLDTPELRAITPDWAYRVADYEAFTDPELLEHTRSRGIHVIGYRELQALM